MPALTIRFMGQCAASQEPILWSCKQVVSFLIIFFTVVLQINLFTCGLPSFDVDQITLQRITALNNAFL